MQFSITSKEIIQVIATKLGFKFALTTAKAFLGLIYITYKTQLSSPERSITHKS
jgi:hypothetical protein